MTSLVGRAFGAPGIPPTWTSSAKDLVTTALGSSRLWATIGHGIVDEVYWPATGRPQIRDLGFIVAGRGKWAEVKRVNNYALSTPAPQLPLPAVVHTGEGYRLGLEFLPDPIRDVLLISWRLEAEEGTRLYPLLAPHLGGSGHANTGWIDDGLFATGGGHALCLLAEPEFLRASAGYVGFSDGWQDFARNGGLTWQFERAEDGNVALMGELEAGEGVLALAFAATPEGAHTLAAASVAEGYGAVRERFVAGWEGWGGCLTLPKVDRALVAEACLSAAMLRVHEDRTYPGAVVASLSIPWGDSRDDSGGYHLVWARDTVEAGFGLLAIGDVEGARRMLAYLVATQSDDGRWRQNFFPDGRPFWTGVQLDEVGLPILLAAKLRELGCPQDGAVARMVRRAAAYLAHQGPVSPQDRWEENSGASPFTLAVEVAALVAAADYFQGAERDYALALADAWNERIEEWTYAVASELAREQGVAGHYVRIAPNSEEGGLCGRVEVRNRDGERVPAGALVGLEFLYLARLGLRSIDDPRLQDSLQVADAVLRVDTPAGPGYRRYNLDGYGEHEDGSAFDGSGVGRLWPLLTGERGHAALLAGEDPSPYLETMARMTGPGGLIPEQVWDTEPIPERELYPGKPTGSAMPLVWAHAEFLKLATARERRPIELLDAVVARYDGQAPVPSTSYWRAEIPLDPLPAGRSLVIEDRQPFLLHLGFDGWHATEDRSSAPLAFGMHGVRLGPSELSGRRSVEFTRFYPEAGAWEAREHRVHLQPRVDG